MAALTLHNIARLYPGLSPAALKSEDADFWLRHISTLTEAGIIEGEADATESG